MTEDRSVDSRVAKPPVETLVFGEPRSAYAAVLAEFFSILRDVRRSRKSRKLFVLAGCLLVVLVLNMLGQVYLNRWQGHFFRAIERKNLPEIWGELSVFVEVVILLLGVVVAQTFFHERLKIGVREWMSNHLLDQWLVPGRAYRLALSSDEAVNPDQRIQEDTRNFSEMTTDLGVGLVGASLILVSFIGVLWVMSHNVHFTYDGHVFSVPGYMVWVAVLYAAAGSYITARVGRPLITLNETRYANEANLRFSVVRVSESSESVAFYKGEADERRIIQQALDRVVGTMRQVSVGLARLTWITQGYGFVMIVLPVMVALPGYLQGSLDLGGLMMVVGAFNQVQGALRWFVDNFARIAEWRAALHRVVVFRDAINLVDQYEGDDEQIQLLDHPEGHLSFEGAKISLVDGEVVIADATAVVRPGERVLITGESGTGKSTLFRAVGGLWPWGSGVIRLPPRDQIMFLPQKPYMPLGTLAEALSYPHVGAKRDAERMKAALTRVNLEEFIPQLNETERWDKLMSLGQQQRLAFARLFLHRPKWVFLDEATSALDDKNQDVVMSLFTGELEGTTILSIGHRHGLADYHTRTLHLTTGPAGVVLRRRARVERRPLWARTIDFLKRGERGVSLVEALVALGIFALVTVGFAALMTSMRASNRALSDNVESYDLERQFAAILSDEAVCSCQLARARDLVTEARSPTGRVNARAAELDRLTTSCETSAPSFAEVGQVMTAKSGSFKVARVSVRDLIPTGRTDPQTGRSDEYMGAFYIEFARGGAGSSVPHTVKLSKIFGASADGTRLINCASTGEVFPGPAVTNSPLVAQDLDSVAPCWPGYSIISGGWVLDGTKPSCPNPINDRFPFPSQNHPVVDPKGTHGWRVRMNCVGFKALAMCARGRQ